MLFVLIGPTRSGKSTFINSILGENVAKEGIKGEIESTTTKISNYVQIQKGDSHPLKRFLKDGENTDLIVNFVDTMGLFDSELKYTNKEISDLIKA